MIDSSSPNPIESGTGSEPIPENMALFFNGQTRFKPNKKMKFVIFDKAKTLEYFAEEIEIVSMNHMVENKFAVYETETNRRAVTNNGNFYFDIDDISKLIHNGKNIPNNADLIINPMSFRSRCDEFTNMEIDFIITHFNRTKPADSMVLINRESIRSFHIETIIDFLDSIQLGEIGTVMIEIITQKLKQPKQTPNIYMHEKFI